MSNFPKLTLDIERGVPRFSETTGEPLEPSDYCWLRDEQGVAIHLISGRGKEGLARLWVAAPEMLAELESVLEALLPYDKDGEMNPRVERINAVIAKAKGGA